MNPSVKKAPPLKHRRSPLTSANVQQAREERLQRVNSLYLQGMTQHEIAVREGIAQQTVSGDLAALRARWMEAALEDTQKIIVRELAKLDELERGHWAAWHRSVGKIRAHSHKRKSVLLDGAGEDGKGVALPATEHERSTKTEFAAGDPRYLDSILRIIERRCAMLGIDAPKKVQGSFAVGLMGGTSSQQTRDITDLHGKTDAELAAIYRATVGTPGAALHLTGRDPGGAGDVPALSPPPVQ